MRGLKPSRGDFDFLLADQFDPASLHTSERAGRAVETRRSVIKHPQLLASCRAVVIEIYPAVHHHRVGRDRKEILRHTDSLNRMTRLVPVGDHIHSPILNAEIAGTD